MLKIWKKYLTNGSRKAKKNGRCTKLENEVKVLEKDMNCRVNLPELNHQLFRRCTFEHKDHSVLQQVMTGV